MMMLMMVMMVMMASAHLSGPQRLRATHEQCARHLTGRPPVASHPNANHIYTVFQKAGLLTILLQSIANTNTNTA